MLIIYKTEKYPTRLAPVGYKIKDDILSTYHVFLI